MFFSDHGGVQWLVVFLGNPGLKYRNTRHNAGFLAADAVERECGVSIDRLRFHALTAQAELGGQKVLLMKPQTYMNDSGEAVVERQFLTPGESFTTRTLAEGESFYALQSTILTSPDSAQD